ncbi:MAG TPA: gfo/Idh/MocA family oxidoreductase [Actinobacteria bacterium]|nr:gfo/Idh/MocA family oxidoreductase [Actinomycetota bacterium]
MEKKDLKVGIGIIGAGSVAEIAHFPSIAEIDRAELIAVADTVEKYAERAVKKWGAKAKYRDYQEMIKRDDIDLVIIASPNFYHHEHAIACAQAGKHVIIEKPFACTNYEAWDIVNTAKKYNTKVMVGCNYRFWEQHIIAKELISQGIIGDIKMGSSKSHESWDLYHEMISYTQFRADPKLAGAGALFDLGSHMVDLLLWFIGKEPKRVCGIAKNITRPKEYTPLDDCVYIQIEFEDNTYGMVDLNRYSPAVTQGCELLGTKGTILTSSEAQNPYQTAPMAIYIDRDYSWDELPEIVRDYRYPQVFWATDNVTKPLQKRWVSIYPPRGWAYKKMIEHFIDCIANNSEPMIKMEDGAKVMEVLCAVFKSMDENGWVDLPLKEEIIPPYFTKGK